MLVSTSIPARGSTSVFSVRSDCPVATARGIPLSRQMDRSDQAEVRLRVAAVERKIRQADLGVGLLLRRLYLFRFSLLASPFVFTHASSVPRVAEFAPNDFKSAEKIAAQ